MNKIKGPLALAFSESLTKLIGLMLLPVITDALTLEEFGIYALFLINYIFFSTLYIAILNNFILVGYFTRQYRIVYEVKSAMAFNTLFFIVLSILFFSISSVYNFDEYFYVFFISSLSCIIAQPSQVYLTFKQCQQKYISYAKFSLTFVFCYVVLALLAYYLNVSSWQGYALLVLSSHLFQTLLLLFIDASNVRLIYFSKMSSSKRYIKHFKALIGNSLFGWARVNVDKYLIITILGTSVMATYSLGFQLGAVIGLLNTILIKLLNPILFASFKSQVNAKARKLTIIVIACFAVVSLSYTLLLPFIVNVFFPAAYESSIQIAQLVSVGYCLQVMVSVVGAVLFYEKRNYLISALSMASFTFLLVGLMILYSLNLFSAYYVALFFVGSWCFHLILTLFFALKEPKFIGFIKNA